MIVLVPQREKCEDIDWVCDVRVSPLSPLLFMDYFVIVAATASKLNNH